MGAQSFTALKKTPNTGEIKLADRHAVLRLHVERETAQLAR